MAQPAFSMDVIVKNIPDAKIVGTGTLSLAFWDIYDATLYAPDSKINKTKPFALTIRYMREIEGRDIADRSAQEIRKQGFVDEFKLTDWNRQLKNIFPSVANGTVLSAIFIPGDRTIFYDGSRHIGTVKDAEFTIWFANIWLGEKTSEPVLRRRLLGLP